MNTSITDFLHIVIICTVCINDIRYNKICLVIAALFALLRSPGHTPPPPPTHTNIINTIVSVMIQF